MAYYNNYNRGYDGGGYNGGGGYQRGYSRGGFGGGYSGGGNRNYGGGQPKKRTGAKWHQSTKNGQPCISAWNASRQNGLVKILIAPYSGTKAVRSQSGREWHVWMCKVEGRGIASDHFPVLVDPARQMAIIRKWGWVANCRARNGGYCGTFTKK